MRLPTLLRTPPPSVALEITPRHVAAVEVSGSRGGSLRVSRHAVEPLAPGTVVPSLNAPNVADPLALAGAVRRVWDQLGKHPRRVALVVPDGVAKVSFIRFQSTPARAADLDEMLRFQIRKAAPFRIEDSLVSFSRGIDTSEGGEFVVLQARRDIVAEYETACRATGAEPGLVDIATFSVVNAVLGAPTAPAGDWLLVHVSAGGLALAILRDQHIVFFRHRLAEGDDGLGDLVHQTAMYYQDRLGGSGFSRVCVAGAALGDGARVVGRTVEARLGRAVEFVASSATVDFGDRVALEPSVADALTPAIGVAVAQRLNGHRRRG